MLNVKREKSLPQSAQSFFTLSFYKKVKFAKLCINLALRPEASGYAFRSILK